MQELKEETGLHTKDGAKYDKHKVLLAYAEGTKQGQEQWIPRKGMRYFLGGGREMWRTEWMSR